MELPIPPAQYSLSELEASAEQFAELLLHTYTDRVKDPSKTFAPKEINDPLWGSIALTPLEVALVDSPLVQRLRYVRQLGVVHWVYPGAVHTRFEHTLGVLHQVQHLTSALNSLANTRGLPTLFDDHHRHLLRMCAIFHDIGHAAFSHVSEMALQSIPEISTISSDFARLHKAEGKSLSEIFAFYVVRSNAVKELLRALLDRFATAIQIGESREGNLAAIIDKVSNAIIGRQIDNRVPLMHEIISGPFDADKLDYFVRDAKMAGTPSVVDISRLVQKASVLQLNQEDLPEEIAKNVTSIDKYLIFGIKWSGISVLDELHLARVLLYAKIYRHTKVIAIEQMLRGAIQSLSKVASPNQIVNLLYRNDDDRLLLMNADTLKQALNHQTLKPNDQTYLECAANIFANIRSRHLSVKAFQLQRRYPRDPLEGDDTQVAGLRDLREEIAHPEKRELIKQKLIKELGKILALITPDKLVSEIYLDASVMVHHLGQTPGGTQIERAYLLPSSGKPIPFREYLVNRNVWAASYLSDQPGGFVFAPPEIADYVYVAVEKLTRTEYNVRLPAAAMEASKRKDFDIQKIKRKLAAVGFYNGAPFDLRPTSERLNRADVNTTINHFIELMQQYQAPQSGLSSNAAALSARERVRAWLSQFESDGNVECALRVLRGFKLIGRKDTVDAVRTFVEGNPSFRGATVVPFGDARDSGAIQAYFSADLVNSHIGACKSLEEAAKSKPSSVIFIDDFIGSGGQGQDILARGFGLQDLGMPLNEQRHLFDQSIQDFLRATPIAFVFTAGWDAGAQAIQNASSLAGLSATVYLHLKENQIPFLETGTLADVEPSIRAEFLKYCSFIGEGLMKSTNASGGDLSPEAAEEKIKSRTMGYGNRAMLLASPFNVPTQTLTLIWSGGSVDGADWLPLLPRRKKI